jgi:hypothetical protein
MKLVEQVRIDVKQVQRRRIGQPDDFEITEEQEEVVELSRLAPKLTFVLPVRRAVEEIAKVSAQGHGAMIAPFAAVRRSLFAIRRCSPFAVRYRSRLAKSELRKANRYIFSQ